MQNLDVDPNVLMCSLTCPACSQIITLMKPSRSVQKAPCDESDSQPFTPKDVFVELIMSALFSVEVIFNNTMHKQTVGLAMGSPLSSALANIFFGYYEKRLFSDERKPPVYFRYIDRTVAIFDHEAEANKFLIKLNCLHPSLKFTFEKEEDKCLPFLDVYFGRTDIDFEISVHRKPLFKWPVFFVGSPFSPSKRKISLISTLVYRALMICTRRRLNGETERLKKILLGNGIKKILLGNGIKKNITGQ